MRSASWCPHSCAADLREASRFPNRRCSDSSWRGGSRHGFSGEIARGLFGCGASGLARRSKTVNQSRRLLSLAAVRDGMDRGSAAKIGGMDRQTLRDWVHRFNGRVWRASSTTGRRVPSLVFRRSNWLSSRRSSRRVRIVSRTGSCAGVGSTSSASSPRGSASPTSVRGPVIQLKTSGPSRLSKNVWPAPSARGLSRLAADPVCVNVSGLEELPPAMMEIRALRSS